MNLSHALEAWDSVLEDLRQRSILWQGNPLSVGDYRTYTEAIVLCGIHLMDLLQLDGEGRFRICVSWCHDVARTDVYVLAAFLSDAVDVLKHVHQPRSYNWFKRQLCGHDVQVGRLLAPIKPELAEFLSAPTGRTFHLPYQFLSFLTRVTLRDIPIDMVTAYKEHEERLRTFSYDPSTLADLNKIMREWMAGFVLTEENYLPSHGPGASAETKRSDNPLLKYLYLRSDPLIRYVFSKFAGVDVTCDPCHDTSPYGPALRTAKFVAVAKSLKTKRVICKEPAGLLWYQQAVRRVMYEYVHDHPYLSRHIDFRDQAPSGALAVEASLWGSHGTIDLSNASDSVTTSLVKGVFHGTPVYPFLVALRSRNVLLPGGECIAVEKYAPMGSALCFPVQTLIFSAIVELAVRRTRALGFPNGKSWRVFGDDIIVEDIIYHDVVALLEDLNFTVNKEKSFTHPFRFREACGCDGYDGRDVSPLRISRGFVSVGKDLHGSHPAVFPRLRDLANSCYDRGYRLTRAWVMRVILSHPAAPPLFSATGRGALISDWPDNYRARRSRSKLAADYQQIMIKVIDTRTHGGHVVWPPLPVDVVDQRKWSPCPGLEFVRYVETLRRLHQRALTGYAQNDAVVDESDPDDLIRVYSRPPVTKLMVSEVVLPPFLG